jgi:hypothetical protein
VVLNLVCGQVRITAGDRPVTSVEAYPRDSGDQDDVRTAGVVDAQPAGCW